MDNSILKIGGSTADDASLEFIDFREAIYATINLPWLGLVSAPLSFDDAKKLYFWLQDVLFHDEASS